MSLSISCLFWLTCPQVDEPSNPHGLEHGWRWLARALNSLPADRVSSKALACFLRTGGFGLHRRFKGQLVKLLRSVEEVSGEGQWKWKCVAGRLGWAQSQAAGSRCMRGLVETVR